MRHSSGTRCSAPSPETISAVSVWRGFRSPCNPRMVTFSSPFRPSDVHDVPSSKVSGNTPMPTRLERWMRSKLWQLPARTPRRRADHGAARETAGALGAPAAPRAVAVFGAGEHHQRHALLLVLHRRVVD